MKNTQYFCILPIVFFCLLLCTGCQKEEPVPFNMEKEKTPLTKKSVEIKGYMQDAEVSITNPELSHESRRKNEILIKANYIIGEFSTSFSKSSDSRKKNIRNAARKVNRIVVYPGEEFSISEHILPFTEENGYYPAGTFINGRVVNSLGGGVCQVSTTLYNAVLDAELTVVERHAHSKAVSYVEVGRDAAIAENQMDFRFMNSLDVPIVIEAVVTSYDVLIFRLRCVKRFTDVSREVTYETKILEEIEPQDPIVEYDLTKPGDYIRVIQSAYKGYKVAVYRVVKINGIEVERVKISYNEYEASPQYMVLGKK